MESPKPPREEPLFVQYRMGGGGEPLSKANRLGGSTREFRDTFIQTQLLEISRPGLSAINLLAPETYADDLIKIVTCCDCHDVHAACIAPAQPTASNKHLVLYLAVIREFKSIGRVREFTWIDTRDTISNALTKLGDDKTIVLDEIGEVLKTFVWKLKHPMMWGNSWSSEV